jgi:alanyl-tRNA synthetase
LPDDPKAKFTAVVDKQARQMSASNHSATHLLHEALRNVLGTHVEQKGSLVHPDHLRFDFSHFSKMSDEELEQVERQVNVKVRENILLDERRSTPIDDAKEMGAMALFGEKYGDVVRVIKFGSSIELCGGTHVKSTGEIGFFKIISESAVAAGIRRIEAITSFTAEAYFEEKERLLKEVNELLKHPKDTIKAIADLLEHNHTLQKKLEGFIHEKAILVKKELLTEIKNVNGVNFLARKVDLDAASIKDISFQLKAEVANIFMVLVNEGEGKAGINVLVHDDLVKSKNMHAGNIVKELAKEINGGGGGQPFFATAGGTKVEGLVEVLKKAMNLIS